MSLPSRWRARNHAFERTAAFASGSATYVAAGGPERLINANVGMRVIDVGLDGFDTHAAQLGGHPGLLGQLDEAIAVFYGTLAPQWRDRVTIMTMSDRLATSAGPSAAAAPASSSGSIRDRVRAWTTELARLAAETGLAITVGHLPPGTSKWNRIEHRLFSAISVTAL